MRSKKKRGTMSLVGHLKEMRDRLALSVVVLLAAFAVCFALIRGLADRMLEMGVRYGFQYVYLAPSELLTTYFKLALILGAVIASPFLLFELWGFVAPALRNREKKAVLPALFGGFGFFLIGALFAYVIALPFMIQFLVDFSQSAWVHASISVASYIDFVVGMILVFGLVFEMPLLAYVLTRLGVLSPKLLRRVRRYFVPVAFLLAAVITPPDVASQFMVAVPMLGLYELSIFISMAAYRQRKADEDMEEDWEDEDDEEEEEDEAPARPVQPPTPVDDDDDWIG